MNNTSETALDLYATAKQLDWDAVYASELSRIYNFFLYKVGDRDSAQDLTATTFERAWKSRAGYRPSTASVSTWLFGIARNVLKEHLRKGRLNRKRLNQAIQAEETPISTDIERIYQQEQEKESLRKILLELPKRQQDLIALKYGAGLTNREIAQITGLSESNVGSILHRTVTQVRARLESNNGR